MEDEPFSELKMKDFSALDKADQRVVCPLCGRKRMYFCYSCIKYVNGLEKDMPTVQLPVQIHIIKHKQELESKSTAIHAALLAPEHCHIYSFPDIPKYNKQTDVVVFPSADSVTVEEWSEKRHSDDAVMKTSGDKTVIFIDCTWNQIHPIITSPQLAGLPKIAMHKYSTKFWRPNGSKRDASCLATIEAIYYFLREYHTIYLRDVYDGQYDNLLIIFKYMYMKIRAFHHGGDKLKAYKK